MSEKKYYITTAITYVNSKPHIGHAYEEIGTDVLARWKRINGYDVWFATGSDEHSANVENKCRELGKDCQTYCDEMAAIFKQTWQALAISYDRFIQTSEPIHHEASQEMVRRAQASGDIYKDKYEGWYCNSCETYYTEAELEDGHCPVHHTKPKWLSEENYFFKLSKYQQPLLDYYADHPEFIQPVSRKNEIVNVVKEGLKDISVSRASLQWGIPFPEDEQQLIYVWFDALINYISAIGFPRDMTLFKRFWPCDVHVIGKDITRFHCIIWPAMLMSAGLPLPKRVFGHGFIHLKGEKISKTRGNVLDPVEFAKEYGVDPLRYVLMAGGQYGSDSDFSEEGMIERYNTDLANDMGNLLNRTLAMVIKYCQGIVPQSSDTLTPEDQSLRQLADALFQRFDQFMDQFEFSHALAALWEMVKRANKYIEECAPWNVFKSGNTDRINTIMYHLLEVLRLVAAYIQPVMPATTSRILTQLGYAENAFMVFPTAAAWGQLPVGQKICKGEPLFPRIEKERKGNPGQ